MPSLACDCEPASPADMRYSHQTNTSWQAGAPVITKYPTNWPEPHHRLTWSFVLLLYQSMPRYYQVHFRPCSHGSTLTVRHIWQTPLVLRNLLDLSFLEDEGLMLILPMLLKTWDWQHLSHETNGKAVTRGRGLALPLIFFVHLSHCSVVQFNKLFIYTDSFISIRRYKLYNFYNTSMIIDFTRHQALTYNFILSKIEDAK